MDLTSSSDTVDTTVAADTTSGKFCTVFISYTYYVCCIYKNLNSLKLQGKVTIK